MLIFGGLAAAGIPLAAALVSISGSLLFLLGFTYLFDVDPNVVSVVTVMGLGLAIDYGLLMVSRYREELRRGLDPPDGARGDDVAPPRDRSCSRRSPSPRR